MQPVLITMKKILPVWLLATLVILWSGTVATVQAGAGAAAELAAFEQRCQAWTTNQKVFTNKKFERWNQHFDGQKEFEQWFVTLFPAYLERQQQVPMDDGVFDAWLTAKVLAEINAKSLFELLSSGGVLMFPLILCSIVGVTFTLLRAFEYRRVVLFPPHFLDGLKEKIHDSVDAAREYCDELIATNRHQAPAARMCAAGLKNAEGGRAAVEAAVENAGFLEVDRLKRGLRVLQVVIAVAPLLGLVGTVYGMIGSFQSVEMAEAGDDKAKMLSGGIYEALVTTATGLTIAIPMMIIYYFLNTRVDSLAEDFNGLALQFVEICPNSGGGTETAEPGNEVEKETPGEPKSAEPTVIA